MLPQTIHKLINKVASREINVQSFLKALDKEIPKLKKDDGDDVAIYIAEYICTRDLQKRETTLKELLDFLSKL